MSRTQYTKKKFVNFEIQGQNYLHTYFHQIEAVEIQPRTNFFPTLYIERSRVKKRNLLILKFKVKITYTRIFIKSKL